MEKLRLRAWERALFLVFTLQTLDRSELCLPVFMCVDTSHVLKERNTCSASAVISKTKLSHSWLSALLQSPVIIHPICALSHSWDDFWSKPADCFQDGI